MNKKRLPRAVLRTADEMREAGVTSAVPASDNVITMPPKLGTAAPADAPNPATALRRKAIAIVERYANGSAIGGAIPVPFLNAAAITALMIRMVRSLSELYGVPFEHTRTRAIIVALMGGALPTGFATIATSTLSYCVPGLNLFGLAVASVTSGAYARSIGGLYIEHFESGGAIDFRSLVRR